MQHGVNESASARVLHFVTIMSIYLNVFINYSWWKVRTASEAQSLIKQGACMWAWEWAGVGEG